MQLRLDPCSPCCAVPCSPPSHTQAAGFDDMVLAVSTRAYDHTTNAICGTTLMQMDLSDVTRDVLGAVLTSGEACWGVLYTCLIAMTCADKGVLAGWTPKSPKRPRRHTGIPYINTVSA